MTAAAGSRAHQRFILLTRTPGTPSGPNVLILNPDRAVLHVECVSESSSAGTYQLSIGVAMCFPVVANAVVEAVPTEDAGVAAGVNTSLREAGGVFGIALMRAVFAEAGNYASATGCRLRDVAEVYFLRIVDGRIVRAWGLEDTHERLQQLGLSQAGGQAGDDRSAEGRTSGLAAHSAADDPVEQSG